MLKVPHHRAIFESANQLNTSELAGVVTTVSPRPVSSRRVKRDPKSPSNRTGKESVGRQRQRLCLVEVVRRSWRS